MYILNLRMLSYIGYMYITRCCLYYIKILSENTHFKNQKKTSQKNKLFFPHFYNLIELSTMLICADINIQFIHSPIPLNNATIQALCIHRNIWIACIYSMEISKEKKDLPMVFFVQKIPAMFACHQGDFVLFSHGLITKSQVIDELTARPQRNIIDKAIVRTRNKMISLSLFEIHYASVIVYWIV